MERSILEHPTFRLLLRIPYMDAHVSGDPHSWLHDRFGSSILLAAAPIFTLAYSKPAFSMDAQYLAYTSTIGSFKTVSDTLYLINTSFGQKPFAFKLDEPVSWPGWMR